MFNKNKIIGSATLIYNDKDLSEDIVITNRFESITLSPEEFIGLSSFFWKSWALARIKNEVLPKDLAECRANISAISEKLSYW